MNQTPINPTPIQCKSAGEAISVLELARKHCLSASYHPNGGERTRRYVPITHTIWVMGTKKDFQRFAADLRTTK